MQQQCFFSVLVAVGMLCSRVHGKSSSGGGTNPADELAELINQNRSSSSTKNKLAVNPGLACLALQYIQAYEGQCGKVGPKGAKPSDEHFSKGFADECGVEAKSVSKITGVVLACDSKYHEAPQAFSSLLFNNDKTLQTLHSKNQSEFGVGISGYAGGSPYFWCVVFSSGPPNSTFSFVQGKAKFQKTGCFSGAGEPCRNAAPTTGVRSYFLLAIAVAFLIHS